MQRKIELSKRLAESEKPNIQTLEDLQNNLDLFLTAEEKQWAIHQTAELIKEKYHIKTYEDNGVMLEYNDGMYKNSAEPMVLSEIERYWQHNATKHIASEVVEHIKRASYVDRDSFNKPGLVCLNNGVLELETLELKPHHPDMLFSYKLPVDYEPQADCPNIKKFISEVVKPEDYDTIFEMIGYCLYPRNIFEKCFMLHGVGSNGKSTLVKVVKNLLGVENTISVSLQELSDNRYAAGWLYGKLVNLHSDLNKKAIKDSGVFKMVTSGDTITIDAKYSPQGLTFTPTAKQIYSANQLPLVYDDTDAFYRRWIIIDFPNVFTSEQMNRKLVDSLITKEELSGLLNESIKAINRVLAQNDFTTRKTTEEWRNIYVRLSDPTGSFVMDCVQTGNVGDRDYRTIKQDIYDTYVLYCKKNQMPMKTPVWFWRGFRERVSYSESHMQELGIWRDYILGVGLNEEYIKSNVYNTPLIRELSEVSPYCSKQIEERIEKSRSSSDLNALKNQVLNQIDENGLDFVELAILLAGVASDDELTKVLGELKVSGHVFEPKLGFWVRVK
jgi:putative DNA primase/helicase